MTVQLVGINILDARSLRSVPAYPTWWQWPADREPSIAVAEARLAQGRTTVHMTRVGGRFFQVICGDFGVGSSPFYLRLIELRHEGGQTGGWVDPRPGAQDAVPRSMVRFHDAKLFASTRDCTTALVRGLSDLETTLVMDEL